MTPEDDKTWPKCEVHRSARHWCQWTREYFAEGRDADTITFDYGRIVVPVVPQMNLYAEVTIGDEVIPGLSYALHLILEGSDPFPTPADELLVEMGLYTRGEGRLTISSALQDWSSREVDHCPSPRHGFAEEMNMQQGMKNNNEYLAKANLWCIASRGVCYFCFMRDHERQQSGKTTTFNASDYGISSASIGAAARSSQDVRTQQLRDALRSRYSRFVHAGQIATQLGNNAWKGPMSSNGS